MISCKKASELLSQSMDEKLAVGDQVQLKLHMFICEWCCHFQKHLTMVRRAMQTLKGRSLSSNEEIPTLSEAAKDRLREAIAKHDSPDSEK